MPKPGCGHGTSSYFCACLAPREISQIYARLSPPILTSVRGFFRGRNGRAAPATRLSDAMQSHYHITLRMDEAKRLLRETKKNVVSVALDVGYSNPSHFSQFFRREKAFRILLLRISTT